MEFVTYFPGINPKKDSPSTMLRFFSLREAVMAKRYFDILKGYEGKTNFTRDMTDRSCKNLSWHSYPKTGNRPADFEVNKTKSLDQEAEFEEGAGEGA